MPETSKSLSMAKKTAVKRKRTTSQRQAGRPARAPDELRSKRIVTPVSQAELEGYLEDAGRKSLAEHVRDALEMAHEARLDKLRRREG